jgi:hypothetical protein
MTSKFQTRVHVGHEVLNEIDLSAADLQIALQSLNRDPSLSPRLKDSIGTLMRLLPKIRQLKGIFKDVEEGSKEYFRDLLNRHKAEVAHLRSANAMLSGHGSGSRNLPDEEEFFRDIAEREKEWERINAEIIRMEDNARRYPQPHTTPKLSYYLNYNDYPPY